MFERDERVQLRDGRIQVVPGKYFHGQWYYHGSKLLLHETAHPQGLFLTNECDNNALDTIVRKCDVDELAALDEEPAESDGPKDRFFTR